MTEILKKKDQNKKHMKKTGIIGTLHLTEPLLPIAPTTTGN